MAHDDRIGRVHLHDKLRYGYPMENTLPRLGRFLRWLLASLAGLMVLVVGGGQFGLFSGKRPPDLGVHDGRLKPAPKTPNCVNSQSPDGYSRIAPISYSDDGKSAMARLQAVIAAKPAAKIIDARTDYVHAEFASKWLGFVDDVEFHLDESAGVIHLRSASRLGGKDFGVNRQRIEKLRAEFSATKS
jgi:uncharacterized protein (DUF1499 family)